MEGQRLLGAVTWPARLMSEAGRAGLERAFQGSTIEAIVEDVVRYRVVERVVDKLLAGGVVDRVADRLLADGIADRTVDRIIARLTESEEFWRLVEEVAASPAVTEAVTQQTASFADQVAGGVRTRSHSADAWLERQARRALRRPAQ